MPKFRMFWFCIFLVRRTHSLGNPDGPLLPPLDALEEGFLEELEPALT